MERAGDLGRVKEEEVDFCGINTARENPLKGSPKLSASPQVLIMRNLEICIQSEMGEGTDAVSMAPPDEAQEPNDALVGEEQSRGTKRTRAKRSPIMQYLTLVRDRTYMCELCREKYGNGSQGLLKRPPDGSTNVFWKHFKALHRRTHDTLKGVNDSSAQCFFVQGTGGQMERQAAKKSPVRGISLDETKDIIMRYVCATDSPWCAVDHETFTVLWRHAKQADMDPPNAKEIKDWAIKAHRCMKDEILRMFSIVRLITVTIDVFSGDDGCGLLGVTAHWVDANSECREFVLALRELPVEYDSDGIADVVLEVIEDFKLEAKVATVTTHNTASNKKMVSVVARKLQRQNKSFSVRRHVPCFAHFLDLVVRAAMTSFAIPLAVSAIEDETDEHELLHAADYQSDIDGDIPDKDSCHDVVIPKLAESCSFATLGRAVAKVRKLVRASKFGARQRKHYTKLCSDLNMPDSDMLQLDCPTRWSSTYDMLRAAIEKQAVLEEGMSEFKVGGKEIKISRDEWELLCVFVEILEPFSFALDIVTQPSAPPISHVMLMVLELNSHMAQTVDRLNKSMLFSAVEKIGIEEKVSFDVVCKAMLKKMDLYKKTLLANQAITAALLLDPYRKDSILDEMTRAETIAYIRGILSPSPASSSNSLSPAAAWFRQVCKVSNAPVNKTLSSSEQLDAYLRENVKNEGESELAWWAHKGSALYPALAPIARELLGIRATSAPLERVHSVGRAIVAYNRSHSSAESIETLVTMRCWTRGKNVKWYDQVLDKDVEVDM